MGFIVCVATLMAARVSPSLHCNCHSNKARSRVSISMMLSATTRID